MSGALFGRSEEARFFLHANGENGASGYDES
jgi:hypothetical protein